MSRVHRTAHAGISNVAQSAAWIQTQAKAPTGLIVVGSEQAT